MVLLSGLLLAASTLLAGAVPSSAAASHGQGAWVATWGTGVTAVPEQQPEYPDGRIAVLSDQTLRQVVRTSVGGRGLSLQLSNEYGASPLRIGEAQVAVRAGSSGTAIRPATDRRVTFGGRRAVTIPPGAPYRSDPVGLDVPAGADLVISLYLPGRTPVTTAHCNAIQANEVAAGNVTGARTITPVATTTQWLFLSGVAVRAAARPRSRSASVVVLGASLADGVGTTEGTNRRWPDLLADRLRSDRRTSDVGVVNAGIGGNRLLHDPNPPVGQGAEAYAAYFGRSGLRRFDADVLARPGATYVIVDLGTNDLALPSSGSAVPEEVVSAEQLIAGHRQIVARAHVHGLKAYGATIARSRARSSASGPRRSRPNARQSTTGCEPAASTTP